MIIFKIYAWLCWVIGMRDRDNNEDTTDDREFITYMLRRQKQRYGEFLWYGVVIGSMFITHGFSIWYAYHHNLMFIFTWLLTCFQFWLGIHVAASDYTGRKP